MTSNPITKPITAKDISIFGEVIHYRLTKDKDSSKLYNLSSEEMAGSRYNEILAAIEKVFTDLGILGGETGYTELVSYPLVEPGNGISIGDLIYIGDIRTYVVTGKSNNGWVRTFPKLSEDDDYLINYVTPKAGFQLRRPPISAATTDIVAEFAAEIVSDEVLTEVEGEGGSFRAVSIGDDSSHLQIGDIVVGVDPIQISFTTQNGYQIFPTVRTHGNPKLPTMQQIKTIHVTLMFPNEDAINFQLLPIYAMFKRTPFINIKNKDISKFFSEISTKSGWIPVALENIHVSSVDGFPNSLQAEISFLPFDPAFLGGSGFKALMTMNDVWKQQEVLFKDSHYEALMENINYKLRESEANPERLKELQGYHLDTTENFKASLPFRTFYQALIEDHQYVRDEFGGYEQIQTGKDVSTLQNQSLKDFLPTKRSNRLRHYKSAGNRDLVALRYKYVEGDFKELSKLLEGKRLDKQDDRLRQSIKLFNEVNDYYGLSNVIYSTFMNNADALREYEYEFSRVENTINTLLTMHGWNVEMIEPAAGGLLKPGTVLSFIFRSILHSTHVLPVWTNYQSLLNAGEVIVNGKKQNLDLNPRSSAFHDWLGAQLTYNDINTGEISKYGIRTIDSAMKVLWDWAVKDPIRKKSLILIFQQIAEGILRDLTTEVIVVDAESNPDSPYVVKRLPIRSEDVVIDGEENVITNWSVTFSNKFVPFYLQAYKYPYYQHLGSEDATMSLRIRSVPSNSNYDLKAKLSQLSDRMYDSVKLVTHHAPDLYIWLDPRVEMVSHPHSIFNVFGVHHVVVNSSNTTNIQGKPNSWNTILNLTQAEFSLDQYMSLESKQSFGEVEAFLVQLIPKLKYDESSGRWNVRSYMKQHDLSKSSDSDKVSVTGLDSTPETLENILFLSFLDSDYGEPLLRRIGALVSQVDYRKNTVGVNLVHKFFQKWKELVGIDPRANDSEATKAINDIVDNNETFGGLLKSVVRSYEDLLGQQSRMLMTIMQERKGYWALLRDAIVDNAAGHIGAFTGVAVAGFIGCLPLELIIMDAWILYNFADARFRYEQQKLKDRLAVFFNDMGNTIKKELLLNLSRAIIKDPPIRKKLLNPKVMFGDKYINTKEGKSQFPDFDKMVQEQLDYQSYNCYGDFDMPLSKVIGDRIKRTIKLSPDFWIFNPFEQDKDIKEFVVSNTKRIMQTNKIAVQTSIVTHKEALEKLDRVISFLDSKAKQLDDKTEEEATIDLRGYNVLEGVKRELGYKDNLRESYIGIVQKYVDISLRGNPDLPAEDGEKISNSDDNITRARSSEENQRLANSIFFGGSPSNTGPNRSWGADLSAETRDELLRIYDEANKDNPNQDFVAEERKSIEYFLNLGLAPRFDSRDKVKLNVIWSQRMITLIELLEIFTSMESYFSKRPQFEEEFKPTFTSQLFKRLAEESGDLQLLGGSKNALSDLREHIVSILRNWEFIRSEDLDNPNELSKAAQYATGAKGASYKESAQVKANNTIFGYESGLKTTTMYDEEDIRRLKEIKDKYRGGVYHPRDDKEYLQIPDVRQFQEYVYNKIGYYVRLNTVITQYNKDIGPNQTPVGIDLSLLPELKFLDYWNTRSLEASFRKVQIMEDFSKSVSMKKRLNTRMFPTFKLLFIEEDSSRTQILDDYYAYNAVQSIEIVKNKHYASSTAIIKVNNLIGTITDKLSFHRESSDWNRAHNPLVPDDVFFGTLDVKPGTRVQIKLGYSADDKQLTTAFNGRIIEMNAGPVTEMICQSFGAQLNHKLYAEKFGMTASEKEHGDIASALLDRIPGLELLGKRDIFNTGVTTPFSAKNMNKIRKNVFDTFLLSNVLGKVSASLMASDNPRDENIYLPYDLSPYSDWDPKFSWVVYDQSVWEAIKELCLYHRNVVPLIKPYNNDPLSSRSEQRETIVVGEKSGYYKYTDSFALSSLDTVTIRKRIEGFSDVKIIFPIIQFFQEFGDFDRAEDVLDKIDRQLLNFSGQNRRDSKSATLKANYVPAWNYFNDRLNYLILAKNVIDRLDISGDSLSYLLKNKLLGSLKIFGTPEELFIDYLQKFVSTSPYDDPITMNMNVHYMKYRYFLTCLNYLSRILEKYGPEFWDMEPERFFNVKIIKDNIDPSIFAKDPRYKKIQQHHFITDSYNLVSNDISLNSSFANMVNLYYFDNPKMITTAGIQRDDLSKLNMWSTKSFRDLRDEHIRPLNSFQKNIDPTWRDIAESNERKLAGYNRLWVDGIKDVGNERGRAKNEKLMSRLKELHPEFGTLNIHTPDWRHFPSYVVVGVNLLKKEVEQMYRGTIQIVGDINIEPADIVHLEDITNDMHGSFEVEEVIHSFTPQRGLTTTITPCLITYDRDPIMVEDLAVLNRIYIYADQHRGAYAGRSILGGFLTAGSIAATFLGAPFAGIEGAALSVPMLWNGVTGLAVGYHKYMYDTMMNVLGGDVINYTALIHKGLPYMCGFDGVDYTNLKTLIQHRASGVDGFINRLSVFSDPFAAVVSRNLNTPQDFSPASLQRAVVNRNGFFRFFFGGLSNQGNLNDALNLWKMVNPFDEWR